MTSSEFNKMPLAGLVLLMVCLSIAGGIIGGALYYSVDLPVQKNMQAPFNDYQLIEFCNGRCNAWATCPFDCNEKFPKDPIANRNCKEDCFNKVNQCLATCNEREP